MDDDLDALIRRVDPDRWLSSRFVADVEVRADVIAVYAFDHELARAPRVTTQSMLGEIRLAWWREALDEIFEGRPVRGHPAAQALAVAVARRSLSRDLLEGMIDARLRELDSTAMSDDERLVWADQTAGAAAEVCARILGAAEAGRARAAGRYWLLGRTAPALAPPVRAEARSGARRLPAAAFPAVAHAALVGAGESDRRRGLRIIWAVAIGRI
jgi:phytoene synthase